MAHQQARRFDFKVVYSRMGRLHRWRLFTYDIQVATGMEKTVEEAREAGRRAKAHYREEVNARFDCGF